MNAKKKVLIVDDHAMFREGIRSILSGLHHVEVAGEARKGGEACTRAAELQPDLVIMDISLPDMSGVDVTRRIKGILPETKVVILSMYSKGAYIMDAFRAGASGYVTKDSTGLHLKECIGAVLDGTLYLDPALSEDVVQRILIHGDKASECADPAYGALTSREQEITRLIAEGHSIKTIAERLFISRKTVENHRANIFNKLGIHSAVELIRYAAKFGIIDVDQWKT